MDDHLHDGHPMAAPAQADHHRYARVARLVAEALRAANQATLDPDLPASERDEDADGLIQLPSRAPWLDVVADLAVAAGYLADIPAEPPADRSDEPERRCVVAIQAAAGALDGMPGPRAHRDVMVRIALTGALRSAQAAEQPR